MSESQNNSKPSKMSFDELFDNFAKEGSGGISLENIGKWFEQADLRGLFTTADISAEFSKISQNKKEITKDEFQKMLGELAKSKEKSLEGLQIKLSGGKLSSFQETTRPISGNEATDIVDRLRNLASGSGSQKEQSDNDGREKNDEDSNKENKEQSDEDDEKGLAERQDITEFLDGLTNLVSASGSEAYEEGRDQENKEDSNDKEKGQDTEEAAGHAQGKMN